jgi:hypothetical protein
MAFNFPNTPTDGAVYIPAAGGPAYTWSAANNVWKLTSAGINAGVYIGDIPPAAPINGQLWWESDSGNSFIRYADGSSNQWVQFNTAPTPVDPYQFSLADMRLYSNAAGVVALNNKADGTGTDIAKFNTNGSFNVSGSIFIGGSVNALQNFVSTNNIAILATGVTSGSAAIYLRPQGVGNTSGQFVVDNLGAFSSSGQGSVGGNLGVNGMVSSTQNFRSTTANIVLAAQGGAVYFRPNGEGNGTNQGYQTADGRLHIEGAGGYQCKAGQTGGMGGNIFNFYWTGSGINTYIDAGLMGGTSDYRAKKDVADLDSMWETVKALRPISYTYADFSPPSHIDAMEEVRKTRKISPEMYGEDYPDTPLIVGSDVEQWGFVAHELQETLTLTAATGVKDDPTAVQSLNQWPVIAALTKALQEAMARIEVLEAANGV